jgi:hypothetical protein
MLSLALLRARGLREGGAMLSLAAFIDKHQPDLLALSDIEPGDALALATRFARRWAYRGGVAILWNDCFAVTRIRDLYLPSTPIAALERRGFLCVEGRCDAGPLALFATRFTRERERIREVRFARTAVRQWPDDGLIFTADAPKGPGAFRDLGFASIASEPTGDLQIAGRGWQISQRDEAAASAGFAVIAQKPAI